MTTIYEVSKLAGVSLATVSRVINKNDAVSSKTREKVLQAMQTLDYRPNSIAQSLASNRSNSIGVLVSQLDSPFFGKMMVSIEDELRNEGKQVLFAAGHNLESVEKDSIEFLRSRLCDGLIVHCEQASDEYLHSLTTAKIPVVIINRHIPIIEDKCIVLDNVMGGFLATEYAILQGHKDIGYIAGPQDKKDAVERFNGFEQAMAKHGIDCLPEQIVFGNYTEASGGDCLSHLLRNGFIPSIIICANDEMASGAMKQARDLGIDIPKDLSIIGYDNTSFAQYLYPQLTTINNPIGDMGKMAARLILNQAYDQKNTIKNRFQPHVVVRHSVSPR